MTAPPFANHTLGRRQLLVGAAASAAYGTLSAMLPRAGAQRAGADKLILVLNSGGWDTTYVLDPKPGLSSVDAPDGEVMELGGLPVFTHASRPAVTEFFTRYGDRSAIVNGIQVRSFIHPDCRKRMLTGSPSELTPDFGAITAFERGRDLPVPYLALGGQARSGPYGAITGRTGTTNQLAALVDPAAAYPDVQAGALPVPSRGLEPSAAERAAVRAYLEASEARLRATRGQHGYNRRRLQDFVGSLDRSARLREFASRSGLGDRDYTLQLEVQIPLGVRALKEGLSQVVMLQTDDWDTHRDNARQGSLHNSLFAALAQLVEALDREDLSADTLVVVLSEMGRTPILNGDQGKDHWPVTSALLLGAGVQGGRVHGATSDRLDALGVDLQSGTPVAAGNQLQAPNLVAGILQCMGIDPEPFVPGAQPFAGFLA